MVKRLVTILAATMCGGLLSCTEAEPPSEPVIRPVRYQEVTASGSRRTRTFSGTAQAGRESNLSFRVSGAIQALPANVGDIVEAGRLLAELDPKDYELQVQEADASLARAQAEARNAASNYARVRALYESNNASRNDLDSARAGSESVDALVLSLEKRVELARLQLSYTRLKAPVTGAIAAVNGEENENVAAGQVVISLTSGSQAEVEVAMPEVLIAGVRDGTAVTVRFAARPGHSFAATVTEVGVASTGTATTFPVTVRLDDTDAGIRPGMAADVEFTFEVRGGKDQILVPPVAVGEDRRGRFVFVVEPEEPANAAGVRYAAARRRAVEIGDLTELGIEVTGGLSAGDLLVTAGVRRLSDGQRVKLLAN